MPALRVMVAEALETSVAKTQLKCLKFTFLSALRRLATWRELSMWLDIR